MGHFLPQVFRHQLLDAGFDKCRGNIRHRTSRAKAGTVPNDITSISAIALKAISTRMVSPHGIAFRSC